MPQPAPPPAAQARPVSVRPASYAPYAPNDTPVPGGPTAAELGYVEGPGCPDGCSQFGRTDGGGVPCGPPGRVWATLDWLAAVTSGQHAPALVTTSPTGTARPLAGVLGAVGTTVFYGDRRLNNDFRGGFRLDSGAWLNETHTFGVEGNFFFVMRSGDPFDAGGGAGTPILARPFGNALTGLQDALLVAYPGVIGGEIHIRGESQVLGGGVSALWNALCNPCGRLDFVGGYRYLGVSDVVNINTSSTTLAAAAAVPAGTVYTVSDQFRTQNNFHGGVAGLAGERRFGHFYFGGRATVAFGYVYQTVQVNGNTAITLPGTLTQNYTGGFLAQTSNIGTANRSAFAVVPEVMLRFGVQVTDRCRVSIGYNWVYLSDVARAGDQIDSRLNPNLLPPQTGPITGPIVPTRRFAVTDYWMQAVCFGLELRF